MIRLYVEADTPTEAARVVAELKRLGVAAHRPEDRAARTATGDRADHPVLAAKPRHLHAVRQEKP